MSLLKINRTPSRRDLLIFSVAWSIVALGIGIWWSYRLNSALPLGIAAPLGVAVPLSLLFTNRFATLVFLALSFATYPIGFLISHTVLAILYFGIMTPIGIFMRLRGHDPLRLRRPATPSTSHWVDRSCSKDANSYFKQY